MMNPDLSFNADERAAVYRAIEARRDIRHFRGDPVPDHVLERILQAAHHAPSVGFMQPWNFIVVRSIETRQRVLASFEETNRAELARIADQERRALYRSLKLEGILECPLNLVVTCDRNRDLPFVLGRAPMEEMDLYSTCLAIENLWLAARVEGVGVGWVSILDPDKIAALFAFPDGVRLVAYLCVGYPVEFRARPMLEEAGWKERLPLEDLVFAERWGQRPGA
ncbi:MAG: 5,6-dimethylbenzimidazole synthase [Gemmataceae bacterium]